jgi:glycosyltransferase involved in cell wall biosynthesis
MVRILWEQLLWPVAAVGYGVDLLHSMGFVTPLVRVRPAVVTVYDLSFIHYPERFRPLQRLYLTSQTRRSCREARRVVAIAEAGRQEVHRLMGVPLERIDVVRPGVDEAFCRRPAGEVAAFRQREGLPERFILHVGTLQPRKNIPVLLEAVARLRRPDLLLVLVGGKGWYYEEIFARVEALGLGSQVRFTGYVDDEALPLWMQAAAALVFPSVYEGFGMPVAQAMAVGTPVVAANTSAIPEVAGEAALLFEPEDVEALAAHLVTVLDDGETAGVMRERGLAQAARFSWAESGREMAAVYRRALAQK